MKFELMLLIITGFVVMNIYHDGKYFAKLLTWKKYYKMGFVVFSSLCFYLFIKKDPSKSQHIARQTADFIKYMPIDRQTAGMINPILDFTANKYGNNETRIRTSGGHNGTGTGGGGTGHNGGGGAARKKRSVSETKKKYVASKQKWNCGHCKNQLSAWFEVDHIMSLENGGTNEVDNLVALCRECHGEKTAMEHL